MKRIETVLLIILLMNATCRVNDEGTAQDPNAVQADIEALRETVRRHDEVVNSGDVEGLMALYAEDAVQMPPNQAKVIGKASIRVPTERMFSQFDVQVQSKIEAIDVSGDLAYIHLSYSASSSPKAGGPAVSDVGKWVNIYRRQGDGSWKIAVEIWNSDVPSQ
ncbi:DUF4440 domain-containing protein [bacterium]|nr:DUF4440 domain-containing protein [bacterium]